MQRTETFKWEIETWSHRINDKHRLVYEIDDVENVIFILSAWGHYDDK